ncbi:hypothetical protein C8R44DRAFT_755473 [Mycena epipterygia]|nr:hypothetical protein C8R44DRAFT_755473 [Mycena epipterygia]
MVVSPMVTTPLYPIREDHSANNIRIPRDSPPTPPRFAVPMRSRKVSKAPTNPASVPG